MRSICRRWTSGCTARRPRRKPHSASPPAAPAPITLKKFVSGSSIWLDRQRPAILGKGRGARMERKLAVHVAGVEIDVIPLGQRPRRAPAAAAPRPSPARLLCATSNNRNPNVGQSCGGAAGCDSVGIGRDRERFESAALQTAGLRVHGRGDCRDAARSRRAAAPAGSRPFSPVRRPAAPANCRR